MSILADDISVMLADTITTVSVTLGAQTVRGLLSWEEVVDKDSSGFDTFIRRRTVTVKNGALTNPAAGAAITVDGNNYIIHDLQKHASAVLLKIYLAA
jgi:hypothetical protein